jgi:hypothetical protein
MMSSRDEMFWRHNVDPVEIQDTTGENEIKIMVSSDTEGLLHFIQTQTRPLGDEELEIVGELLNELGAVQNYLLQDIRQWWLTSSLPANEKWGRLHLALAGYKDIGETRVKLLGYAPTEWIIQFMDTAEAPLPKFGEEINDVLANLDIQHFIKQLTDGLLDNELLKQFVEMAGSIFFSPIIAMLSDKPGLATMDALHGSKRLIGVATGLPLLTGLITSGIRTSTQDTVKGIADIINNMYFNLGLGFLTWQALAPVLNRTVMEPAEREMATFFRGAQLPASTLIDLYQMGRIDTPEYHRRMAEHGYDDEDIIHLTVLGRRRFGESEIKELVNRKMITPEQAMGYLKALGWGVSDANKKYRLLMEDGIAEQSAVAISTVESAYKKHLIPENEARDYLEAAGKSAAEIDLRIAILNTQIEAARKELSVSQIKAAYIKNIITPVEVRKGLSEAGYESAAISSLIQTWKASKRPKVLDLNKSEILLALSRNVLTVTMARTKLSALTYSNEAIDVLINSVLAGGSSTQTDLSVGMLLEAAQVNLISLDEFRTLVRGRVGSEKEADILVGLARIRGAKQLKPADIQDAFVYGVLDKNRTRSFLVEQGLQGSAVEVLLDTWEIERTRAKRTLNPYVIAGYLKDGIIDENEARAWFRSLEVEANETELLVKGAVTAARKPLKDNDVKNALLADIINADKAVNYLIETGDTTETARLKVESWRKGSSTVSKDAPLSALVDATRKGVLEVEEFEGMLRARGLSGRITTMYVGLATYEPPEGSTPLSKSDILKAYSKGIFDYFEASARLIAKNYSVQDADVLLQMEKVSIENHPYLNLLGYDGVSVEAIGGALLNEGFEIEEIMAAFEGFYGG